MLRRVWATLFAVLLSVGSAAAADRFPGPEWDHIAPADAGWYEAGLAEARDWSATLQSTAVMVIQHGAIVAEWGDTVKRTELASVRKSFLSALVGIAVVKHQISLDSTLAELDIDDNPPGLTAVEKQATVRMLLQARSGIYHPALYETARMAAGRPARGSHEPGTFWYYNNWDFNALGTIYERAANIGIYDALDQQIARPIGMQDYRPADGTYFYGRDSIHRAYPIRMSARDLARFALLYLHDGNWAGNQIVPADWVHESTQPWSLSEKGSGYGYLWWTARPASSPGLLPPGSFFAAGAGGQYAFVLPVYDLIIVHRVDRDLKLPEPDRRDLDQLLHLILKAGGLAAAP